MEWKTLLWDLPIENSCQEQVTYMDRDSFKLLGTVTARKLQKLEVILDK